MHDQIIRGVHIYILDLKLKLAIEADSLARSCYEWFPRAPPANFKLKHPVVPTVAVITPNAIAQR